MKRIALSQLAAVLAALPLTAAAQQAAPAAARYASATLGPPQQQASLFRHADIDTAWAAAQRSRRPMLVYVVSDNCFYCKKMWKETLKHPQIAAGLAGSVESVAVNATADTELAERLRVKAYPTTLVVSPSNQLLYKAVGFKAAEEFTAELWPILSDANVNRQGITQPAAVAARSAAQAE